VWLTILAFSVGRESEPDPAGLSATFADDESRNRIRQFERPEMDSWEFEEWAWLLDIAGRDGQALLVSMLLAGDAGLR
jgi:hypothetical protein